MYGPIWLALDGRTFPSALHLARFVGRFFGYHSATPTHPGIAEDGVGWWLTNALDALRREDLRIASIERASTRPDGARGYAKARSGQPSMSKLVPSGRDTDASLGTLLAVALNAAGVVALGVEEVEP